MSVLGIDEITYCVDDLPTCRKFFLDWGLTLVAEHGSHCVFECQNGCRVRVEDSSNRQRQGAAAAPSTLAEVVWGVQSEGDLEQFAAAVAGEPLFFDQRVNGVRRVGCLDPQGLRVCLQVTRKRELALECAQMNTWNAKPRVNQAAPMYEQARPIEVGHVVFFVADLARTAAFYQTKLGFCASDTYPGRGAFLRCAADGGHHDLFLLQLPSGKTGLNHVAFTVRDIHEVFGGGLNFSRLGWATQLGPGRHPVSSAYFWYFDCPAGGLVEYYADEDQLTADWVPREFEPSASIFAEWAIEGGLDGYTRRQRNAGSVEGQFLTEKKP
ncbi:VOC family protein [Ramlibacter sp. AW1]|uniref:VOC family protein n=1 Tax=Ramlibacter aurantiacus TaxID=2801330 RepID=A0A937D680_9BURK|nr:VOC family protein [Ramlibacter aurantiacus]MBL0420683.1 VOC family protein [Ramlibacter aurantiacus]